MKEKSFFKLPLLRKFKDYLPLITKELCTLNVLFGFCKKLDKHDKTAKVKVSRKWKIK